MLNKRIKIGSQVETTSGVGVLVARTTLFPDGVQRLVVMLARPFKIRRDGMRHIISAVVLHPDNVWEKTK